MQQLIPIVFSVNNDYVKPLAAVLSSVLKNSRKNALLEFNILYTDITKQNMTMLNKLIQKHKNARINYRDVTDQCAEYKKFMSQRDNYNYITIETYFRFNITRLFPSYNKILYLDADIIAEGDICALYNQDISGCYLGAARDAWMELHLKENHKTQVPPHLTFNDYLKITLNIPENEYFNAGVLLMNLELMRQDNIEEKLTAFAREKSPLEFQDQDVLNAVCARKIKFIDQKWNTLNGFFSENTAVYHLIGPDKPWKINTAVPFFLAEKWWRYYKLTPFYNKKQDAPLCALF